MVEFDRKREWKATAYNGRFGASGGVARTNSSEPPPDAKPLGRYKQWLYSFRFITN